MGKDEIKGEKRIYWLGCCLPAIAIDSPALKHTQMAVDGRGGRVSTFKESA
jgi:hypothetical protein